MKWQSPGEHVSKGGNFLTRLIGRFIFWIMGWRISGEFPNRSKIIVALVPHSSNLDFLLTIAVLWGMGLKSSFLIKHTVFWFPLGHILKALGGIPVDRASENGLISQVTEEFQRRSKFILGITPSGTRKRVTKWKKGFAILAVSARVPVMPAILNYETRTVRFAPLIEDVFDVEKILMLVRREAETGTSRS